MSASTLAVWTCTRISSTTSGFDSVVVSPTSMKFEIDAMTRRMILPERVFGRSLVTHTWAGRAIGPMISAVACFTFASTSAVPSYPGFSETNTSGTLPFRAS